MVRIRVQPRNAGHYGPSEYIMVDSGLTSPRLCVQVMGSSGALWGYKAPGGAIESLHKEDGWVGRLPLLGESHVN